MNQQVEEYTCSICAGEGYVPVNIDEAFELNLTMYAQIFTSLETNLNHLLNVIDAAAPVRHGASIR
jgi:hypothetical protein